MNDPNGLVFFAGEYHLFYQYHPSSSVWGPMHWGHAVSTNLVDWEHLPIALYPDQLGYIFSGSIVIDWHNSAGFQRGIQPAMVAIFTYHDYEAEQAGATDFQSQALAFSNDKGRTWTKYEGNPVLPNQGDRDFRDPKVFWHEATAQWVMALAVNDRVQFYGATNLKAWTLLSEFGQADGQHNGLWECPDLFPLEADDGTTRWVLLVSLNPSGPNGGSGTQYFVGEFDGQRFTNDNTPETVLWLDYGRDNYAGVTWSDIPQEDGRRLFIGWMSNWDYTQVVPSKRWRGAMTLPRTLHLMDTANGYRVASRPMQEYEALHATTPTLLGAKLVADELRLIDGTHACQFASTLVIDLAASTSTTFGVTLHNILGECYRVGFDVDNQRLFSDRTASGDVSFSEKFAPAPSFAPYVPARTMQLHVFIDHSVAEFFVDDGMRVMTEVYFPTQPFTEAVFFSEGGHTALVEGSIVPLRSIWEAR